MSGYIDNYASANNPVVDITGNPLKIQLNFVGKGLTTPSDHSVAAFAAFLGIPASLLTLLATPLSQLGDQIWAQNVGSTGQTLHDIIQANIVSQITNAIASFGGGQLSAYNIQTSVPTSGRMYAIVLSGSLANPNAEQALFLSYQIGGVGATFSVHTPGTGNFPLPADPTLNLSFDIELLINVTIPFGVGPLTSVASFSVGNANISPANLTAQTFSTVASWWNTLNGQPSDPFQGLESLINYSANASGSIGALQSLLSQLESFWIAASSFGFSQLGAFIDGQSSLNLRFTHPIDPAPVLTNGALPTFPSLFQAELQATASVVQAGSSIGVSGSHFPSGQASQLLVEWIEATSGNVTQSDVNWGPLGAPSTQSTQPPNPNSRQNFFLASGLSAGTAYTFSVRDEDFFTETPFSAPLTLVTQLTDLIQLSIAPQAGGPLQVIGSASFDLSGDFVTPVTIPSDLADGIYVISAPVPGAAPATTTIRVVAAGEPVPTTLTALTSSILEGQSLTVRGAGFRPGSVNLTIDTNAGQFLGTVNADNTGAFQQTVVWPFGVTGNHSVVAEETTGGPSLNATASVSVQAVAQ